MIENASLTGNCVLIISIGSVWSVGANLTLGMRIVSPANKTNTFLESKIKLIMNVALVQSTYLCRAQSKFQQISLLAEGSLLCIESHYNVHVFGPNFS